MDITKLKSEYKVDGEIGKKLDKLYPIKTVIYAPIEYIEDTEEGLINYSSNEAVSLTISVKYPNYPKEDTINAMKIACLKFLEEFC
ncbi:hypothetical protein GKD08_12315 [Paeniclostridium sordellii]|uniref:hypothetical protein n=1 Tax=Paraclostridium sordellii TaxID=1505 RepID=UPI0005E8C19A|nr:hypothetical protein [Paeniclostridium sordellii]MDU4413043.1 hypothetical protein [Paeniclostridium sordellii]MDU6247475.1 hypothetical protein [Paeniclostridium sordellii]MRZ29536.1 hypothetical protein [Paeniclostridium sordellii]MVO72033.1 hypothetical protein [Paeniclostridium sordellii]CEQ06224.1 Uncharacterised protein [[Clostridium] sordellii] [Paeniclostridium sordellii]